MAGWRCSPPWVAAWRVPALGGACWMLVDGFNWFLSNNLMGFCTKHHKKNTKPPINRSDFQEFNTEGILPTRVSLHAQSSCQSTSASLAICRGGLKDFVAECAEANQLGSMRPVWPVFAATLLCWNLESPSLKTHIANIASKEFW